jgi:hypothetical protein
MRETIEHRKHRLRPMTALGVAVSAFALVFTPASAPRAQAATSFDVLQLNLCNSGFADCYASGKSVDSAINAIKTKRPGVVTINEVCAQDITRMAQETTYRWAFAAAGNKGSGGPYQCSDGRGDYGIAILSHPDNGAAGQSVKKQYSAQDGGNEQRVMLCAPYSRFSACTTHLSADDGAVAAKQCKELTDVATGLGTATVIGGDFNLSYGGNPNVQDCVPTGWFRKGDDSVQHVFATDQHFDFERTEKLSIEGTDHPGFLVELTR